MAAENEDGRSMMAVVARNSGQGRDLERQADRFCVDREITAPPEIGIVV